MRFKERNDLANRCKEWMKDQIENNITAPLDTVHMVLAYLDVNGYLNKVVRCKDCIHHQPFPFSDEHICDVFDWKSEDKDFCSFAERRHGMSYISDYEHGGDPFEYEQCCAEENRKDRIEREEYYREEEDDDECE